MVTENSLGEGSAPLLVIRTEGAEHSLRPGPHYLVGRDPECEVVILDVRVSWHHAEFWVEAGRWQLADSYSTNGTFADGRRVYQLQIDTESAVRLGHPSDGPVLRCTVTDGPRQPPMMLRIGRAPDNDIVVADADASRYHAELRAVAGVRRIVDLHSANGTFVNGRRSTEAP